MYTIQPIFAPLYSSQEESYLPGEELVAYELWSDSGEVIARAETREELLCHIYLECDNEVQDSEEELVRG